MIRPRLAAVALWVPFLGLCGCSALEHRLLYHPAPAVRRQLPEGSPVQDVEIQAVDGTRLSARWCPRKGSQGAILYCPGNAGNLEGRAQAVRDLWQGLEMSVLIFDYPGFGLSEGEPSEAGCYAAAEAAYDWLVRTQGIAPQTIILYGESLGGAMAVELATRRPHRALVLVRTFTSLPDVAEAVFGWLPVRGLVSSRFDNLAKIGQCRRPTFIAQADADRLVPYPQGEQLARASGAGARLFTLHDSDHNDPLPPEFHGALRQFLDANPPAP